ncbi:MAG: metallophosphoesterase [Polyangiaceae bacterium]
MKRSLIALLVSLLCCACARPSLERAERDQEVGSAETDGLALRVESGLATVRRLEAGKIVLWGSAPSFSFQVDATGPTSVRLELQNVLTDAVLVSNASSVSELPVALSTRRAYQVELPSGTTQFRVAAADADEAASFRFALLSDVQEAIDRVSDIYRRMNQETDVRFLFGAGDLTQRGSEEELQRFQRELEALNLPYFTTLGNHELGADPPPYHDYFGRGNFQFKFKGVVFTLLDSASATLDPIVYGWLDEWLAAAQNDVHIVSMHIPPLDPIGVRNGAFGSRAEAAKLLGRLAEGRVDLTVYGHIHSFYQFENAGIPAYISGGGGAIPERFDNVGRHFLVFDVDPVLGVRSMRRVEIDGG